MSPSRPLGTGNPDPLDLDAAERLEHNESGRLELVRARAEKWIGGISALGALLGTVLVVKGRDTITGVVLSWQITAAAILAGALVLLAYGTYRAYQAAFGAPGALEEINPIPITGLHIRLLDARRKAASKASVHVAAAIKSVFAAIALIAVAIAITWFAPSPAATSKRGICVYANGRLVVRLPGPSVAVEQSVAGTDIGPCR